jgi:hypothetical protein
MQQGLHECLLITSAELDGVPRLERADCGFVDTADDEVCQGDTSHRCRLLEQSLLFRGDPGLESFSSIACGV